LKIEVVYALTERQTLLSLDVEDGTSLEQAIKISGILERYPQINLETDKTGIFGKLAKLETILREKDRVEIFRRL